MAGDAHPWRDIYTAAEFQHIIDHTAQLDLSTGMKVKTLAKQLYRFRERERLSKGEIARRKKNLIAGLKEAKARLKEWEARLKEWDARLKRANPRLKQAEAGKRKK